MNRRNVLKQAAAGLTVAGSTTLAGCGVLGGTGNKSPFSVSISDTYVMPREFDDNLVYVKVTLEGKPDSWPEFEVLGTTMRGYRPKISEGEDGNINDAPILYKDDDMGWQTTESWVFEKSEFANDSKETERFVLGNESELESGTEFSLYVHDPEASESLEIGSVTYEGEATKRTPTAD